MSENRTSLAPGSRVVINIDQRVYAGTVSLVDHYDDTVDVELDNGSFLVDQPLSTIAMADEHDLLMHILTEVHERAHKSESTNYDMLSWIDERAVERIVELGQFRSAKRANMRRRADELDAARPRSVDGGRYMPDDVQSVRDALLENASSPSLVSCYHADGEWRLGSAADGFPGFTLVRRDSDGAWFTRDQLNGDDKPYDLERALSDASIWFTG